MRDRVAKAFRDFSVSTEDADPARVGRSSWIDRSVNPRAVLQFGAQCGAARQQVVHDLAMAGLAVRPLRLLDGGWCAETDHGHATCMPYVNGGVGRTRLSHPGLARALGAHLRAIHSFAGPSVANLPAPSAAHLRTSNEQARMSGSVNGQLSDDLRSALDEKTRRVSTRNIDAAIAAYERPGGLVHGDVHPGNVVWDGNAPILIDWARARRQACWYEVIRTVLWAIGPEPWTHGLDERLIGAFGDGYRGADRVHWNWDRVVSHFLTVLLLDGEPYRATATRSTHEFARERWAMARWLDTDARLVADVLRNAFDDGMPRCTSW